MSWSFSAIGSPENVVKALEAKSEQISKDPNDYSRKEFEEVKPHLIALAKQNFASTERGYAPVALSIVASGSATTARDSTGLVGKIQSSCAVEIKQLYGYVG